MGRQWFDTDTAQPHDHTTVVDTRGTCGFTVRNVHLHYIRSLGSLPQHMADFRLSLSAVNNGVLVFPVMEGRVVLERLSSLDLIVYCEGYLKLNIINIKVINQINQHK